MYAYNLILISKASITTAKNIKLCLSIYSNLTGQNPNYNKYAVYLPFWLHNRKSRGIYKALNFNPRTFHFTYLGVAISPGTLFIHNFNHMVSKTLWITSFWKQQHISTPGRVILINYVLMSIPSYTLAIQHILDSIIHYNKFYF